MARWTSAGANVILCHIVKPFMSDQLPALISVHFQYLLIEFAFYILIQFQNSQTLKSTKNIHRMALIFALTHGGIFSPNHRTLGGHDVLLIIINCFVSSS